MARILGIVGSPNKDGLTSRLVQDGLKGAKAAGAGTETMYLSDYNIPFCRGCKDATCWADGKCKFDKTAEERNRILKEADGIIFGAPVYFHDINGLSKDFIDKVRIPPRGGGHHTVFLPTNGKPAFGITIAGGTGKGALTSLGAIYWGLFLPCGLRGSAPVAATRFNFDKALEESRAKGRALVEASRTLEPFEADGLADRLSYFQNVGRINSDFVDDNLFLAKTICEAVQHIPEFGEKIDAMKKDIETAESLIADNKKAEAPVYTSRAYDVGREIWDTHCQ